jgi:hypothetical protein
MDDEDFMDWWEYDWDFEHEGFPVGIFRRDNQPSDIIWAPFRWPTDPNEFTI